MSNLSGDYRLPRSIRDDADLKRLSDAIMKISNGWIEFVDKSMVDRLNSVLVFESQGAYTTQPTRTDIDAAIREWAKT